MNCDSIREFIIDSLRAMNYDVAGIGNDTELGPRGADLESLALAELTIRVEDRFAVKFDQDEANELAVMTVGEFCETVAARASPTASDLRRHGTEREPGDRTPEKRTARGSDRRGRFPRGGDTRPA